MVYRIAPNLEGPASVKVTLRRPAGGFAGANTRSVVYSGWPEFIFGGVCVCVFVGPCAKLARGIKKRAPWKKRITYGATP